MFIALVILQGYVYIQLSKKDDDIERYLEKLAELYGKYEARIFSFLQRSKQSI